MAEALLDARQLPQRSRMLALSLVGAALLLGAASQVEFRLADATDNVQYDVDPAHLMVALLCGALAMVAVVVLCRWTARWSLPSLQQRRGAALALLGLVCLAAWLRFHRLAELPPGLWIDEALNGVQAVQIAARGRPLVALPAEDARTGLGAGYVNLAGLAFAVFDPDDGIHALRAVAAVLGIAGVAALALLSWTLHGPRAALAATAWLAVSQWHLNYSRWGEMPIMSPLLESLLVLGVWTGVHARGWRSWAGWIGAGLCAGIGVYTYQTFRVFVVLAGVAAAFALLRRPRVLGAHWAALSVGGVVALVVAAPMLHYAASEPAAFGERARDTLIFPRDDWRIQLADAVPRSLLAFQFVGDENPRHNLSFAPLLTFVPAMLAPLGLAACLARWRSAAFAIVPIWLAIALVPGMITLEAPHASRLLDAIVPLALLIGIAADRLFAIVAASLPRRLAWCAAAAALAIFVVMAVMEYRVYFVERERRAQFSDAFFPWESAAGKYLEAHAPALTVFLDPQSYDSPTTDFVARRYLGTLPNDVRMLRVQHDFPPADPLERDALYLLPRPYASLAGVIQSTWADAHCEEERDRFGRVNLVACRVPSAALATTRLAMAAHRWRQPFGLRGRFYSDGARHDAPSAVAPLAFAYCEYSLEEPPLGRFARAEWDGFIDLPMAGEYLFRLHPDSTTLTIGDTLVIAHAGEHAYGGGHDGSAILPAGRVPLRITLEPGSEGRYFLWFVWKPPGGVVEIVPATRLSPPVDPLVAGQPPR